MQDDSTIADDALLWRRIPPWHIVFDENLGRSRPSTAAFEDHPNGSPMSVLLASIVRETGRSATDVLRAHDGYSLVEMTAGLAREKNQGVARTPLDDEPAHAEVFGKKTESVKKAFARSATWVVPPSD